MITRKIGEVPTITLRGESLEDLLAMPTSDLGGQGKYSNYGSIPTASIALILTNEFKVYMLRSTGWIDITDSPILRM